MLWLQLTPVSALKTPPTMFVNMAHVSRVVAVRENETQIYFTDRHEPVTVREPIEWLATHLRPTPPPS
jgi:hypothetical protein